MADPRDDVAAALQAARQREREDRDAQVAEDVAQADRLAEAIAPTEGDSPTP